MWQPLMAVAGTWRERLKIAVPLAAFLHDLGKANNHFQAMVRRGSESPQARRHELQSRWLASPGGPLHGWAFGGADPETVTAVLCAVVGHHLKLESLSDLEFHEYAQGTLWFLGDHTDFASTLSEGARYLVGPKIFRKPA